MNKQLPADPNVAFGNFLESQNMRVACPSNPEEKNINLFAYDHNFPYSQMNAERSRDMICGSFSDEIDKYSVSLGFNVE